MARPHLPGMKCPICAEPARVRTSRELTPFCRELKYQCQDVDCGFTFRAELVITHMISPSALPLHGLSLPALKPGAMPRASVGRALTTPLKT